MTTVKYQGGIDILRLPVNKEEHVFPPWFIKYTQSHILYSKCSKTGQEDKGCPNDKDVCQFCLYSQALDMPHMPDMVFPNNVLHLKHRNGAILEFRALDALKRVSNGKVNIQIACSEAWRESRADQEEYLKETVKPFDWTFSTDYMGTMSGFEAEETGQRIDLEKLKRKDKILFYTDLSLFEDELHDNGIASLSVKMRVMPGTFYILLRYFLRIDNVMLRVNDTRIYHEFGDNYLLREYTSREARVDEIQVSPSLFVQPNEIAPHLPLVKSYYHKLKMPQFPEPVAAPTLNLTTKSDAASSSTENKNSVPENTENKDSIPDTENKCLEKMNTRMACDVYL